MNDMGSSIYLEFLTFNLKFCNTVPLSFLPYKWETGGTKIGTVVPSSRKWILSYKIKITLTGIYTLLLAMQTVSSLMDPNLALESKCLAAGFLLTYVGGFSFYKDFTNCREIPQFIRFTQELEKELKKENCYRLTQMDKIISLLLYPCYPFTLAMFFFGMAILIAVNPCMPPFLGSRLHFCKYNESLPISWIFIYCIEIMILCANLSTGSFYLISIGLTGTFCLSKHISVLLRCAEMNAGNTLMAMRTYHLYQTIKLVEKSFSDCVRWRILPTCALAVPLLQIVTILVLIRFRTEVNNEVILMFAMAALDAMVLLMAWFTVAAIIRTKSYQLLNKFKGCSNARIRKCFKGCLPLMIRFGNNFIDKDTPLIIQNFCFSTLGSLLIISRR